MRPRTSLATAVAAASLLLLLPTAGDAGLVDDGTNGLLALTLGLMGVAALGLAARRPVRDRA